MSEDKALLLDVPVDRVPWWCERLKKGEVIDLPSIDGLPPEAARERKILQQQGVRSIVDVPIVYRGRTTGSINLSSVREGRRWSEDEIGLLQLTGQIFISAW